MPFRAVRLAPAISCAFVRMALLVCTNETDSVGELTRRQEVQHTVASDAGNDRGRDPELLYRGSLRPPERGPRGAPERALFAPIAALGLAREQLGDVAVRERGRLV